jgi:hypothetical protein
MFFPLSWLLSVWLTFRVGLYYAATDSRNSTEFPEYTEHGGGAEVPENGSNGAKPCKAQFDARACDPVATLWSQLPELHCTAGIAETMAAPRNRRWSPVEQ